MRCALFFLAVLATADPPSDVVDFFRTVVDALKDGHSDDPRFPSTARPFLDKVDSAMPGFVKLRSEVEALVAAGHVGSAIEFVTDEGDESKRMMELDWLLEVDGRPPRRQILKCTIERRGKKWKITALEPLEFFE